MIRLLSRFPGPSTTNKASAKATGNPVPRRPKFLPHDPTTVIQHHFTAHRIQASVLPDQPENHCEYKLLHWCITSAKNRRSPEPCMVVSCVFRGHRGALAEMPVVTCALDQARHISASTSDFSATWINFSYVNVSGSVGSIFEPQSLARKMWASRTLPSWISILMPPVHFTVRLWSTHQTTTWTPAWTGSAGTGRASECRSALGRESWDQVGLYPPTP